jgi:hypothetical protein
MHRAGQIVIAFALLSLGASGDPESPLFDNCLQKFSGAEFDRCLERIAGFHPIGAVATPNATTIRALITTHEQVPEFWIQISKSVGDAPEVQVQSLLFPRFSVRAQLAESDWDDLRQIAVSSGLAEADKPKEAIVADKSSPITVCITVAVARFEIADGKKISRYVVGGCQKEFDLVSDFIDRATQAIPECASLPKVSKPYAILRLENCSLRAAGKLTKFPASSSP